MKFEVGDIVEALDDLISGVVKSIDGDLITIETDEGFPLVLQSHELIKKQGDIQVSNAQVARIKGEKEVPKKPKSTKLRPKDRTKQLEFAIRKKIQRVVFIHGVGEGVLKLELQYLFKHYDNLKFYDADYQKYGLGATEVYIYQNVKH